MRFVVEEASEALPLLGAFVNDEGVDVDAFEEFLPPFDDVFVELIEQHRANDETSDEAEESDELIHV